MEAIKITVEVSVNLSENTQNFIKSLFDNVATSAAQAQKSASAAPAKPAPQSAPALDTKPQAPVVAPAKTKPVATPAHGVPAAQAASSVSKSSKSIEDVRAMLAKKVNEHRDVIKQKLNELGAPSVTKLDTAKYDEMFNFLESL